MRKQKTWRLPALLYALALVLWLVAGLGRMVVYFVRQPVGQDIIIAETEYGGLTMLESEDGVQRMSSNSPDTQIILRWEEGRPVYRLLLSAQPDRPIGEMVLYYNTAPGQDFSEDRKLWARQDGQGNWIFDLDGRCCTALRLDLDSIGGVVWAVESLRLNPRLPWYGFFAPGAQGLFWLLVLPGLVAALLWELLHIFSPYIAGIAKKRRRKN